MTRSTWLLAALLLGASTAALIGWRKVAQLRSETESLRAQIDSLQEQNASSSATATAQRDRELENLRSQTQELLRLRNEVTQLRTSAKDADKLRADNQQLLSENQRLRTGSGSAAASNPSPAKDQLARDNWTCQYCGSRSNLTVDHVIPRSKGGTSGWDNIVASCAPCNRRKGDALPRQVGMRLLKQPRIPNPGVFIHVASPTIPTAWLQYLAA